MTPPPADPRVVRVVPDVPTLDKAFDYLVPPALAERVAVGARVRVGLHGRRIGGWVVGDWVEPPPGVALRPLALVTGWGPPPDLVELAGWAAWRWAGRRADFLGTASPPTAVRHLPPPACPPAAVAVPAVADRVVEDALEGGCRVLRLPPAGDLFPLVAAAAALGPALVVAPSTAAAAHLASRLRRQGTEVALVPGEWARARAGGCTVVGARAGAWAPVPGLAAVVVLDVHDEVHQEERAPTWHARDVAVERARRAGVPCVLASPCPDLVTLACGPLVAPSRKAEREGWPILDVDDRRSGDPRAGLYGDRLVALLRSGRRVVCVLNRKGRARLLACGACGELTRCERCRAGMEQVADGAATRAAGAPGPARAAGADGPARAGAQGAPAPAGAAPAGAAAPAPAGAPTAGAPASARAGAPGAAALRCRRCGRATPWLCSACGSQRLKVLRVGVSRVREELEALAGGPIGEVTADTEDPGDHRVLVGTEAVLHRVDHADAVAFLDFDQELLAPRFRAGEQALALLARAARLVGGRASGGRVLVQTRLPGHPVLAAALHGDPTRLSAAEAPVRAAMRLPPAGAVALVSGQAAEAFVGELARRVGETGVAVEILGPADGRWLVRAPDHARLCDTLAAVARPSGRLRVEVDPLRA